MLGCCRAATASASVRNRCKSSGDAWPPARIIFRATIRLRLRCRALYTTPMPPRPNSARISYPGTAGGGPAFNSNDFSAVASGSREMVSGTAGGGSVDAELSATGVNGVSGRSLISGLGAINLGASRDGTAGPDAIQCSGRCGGLQRLLQVQDGPAISPRELVSVEPLLIDDVRPLSLARPAAVAELGELIRRAAAEGFGLFPVGGGTHLHIGLPPARPGVAVAMTALDQVIDYPARDM